MDPLEYDGIRDIDLIMYGIPGFDNVFQGFLTIFQILTLESWVYLMYNFSDAGSPEVSVIFFVLVVLLGAFFTMNLVLAIIVDSFNEASIVEGPEEESEEDEEENEGSKSIEKSKEELFESDKKKSNKNGGVDAQHPREEKKIELHRDLSEVDTKPTPMSILPAIDSRFTAV